MRIFVALLIALSVLYFWDVEYNHGTLSDGLRSMVRSISHNIRGRQLVTLQDAGNYITKLPKAEHSAPEWQAANPKIKRTTEV